MEAAALPSPARTPSRGISLPATLLRLRTDEQLVALFRAGSDEAFSVIHERYRVRLMAYCRQMLGGSHADAEDVLQDVFVRAHAALRASDAPIALRAWLYRIAHNRCVDGLRRPAPMPSEIMPGAQPALSRGAHHDPPVEAERSEDLRRLVRDLLALPEQQRSALLMRELQGLTYDELAATLGVSVGAVKSLLVRARDGVASAAMAREAPCPEIRLALAAAHDRGVRPSGQARRHLRECPGCREHRLELRNTSKQLAALVPPVGLLGHLGLMTGLGGGGGTGGGLAAAGGGAGGGLLGSGGGAALCGAAGTAAGKVAAIVCAAALVGGAGDALSSAVAARTDRPAPAPGSVRATGHAAAPPAVHARRIAWPTPAVRARTVSAATLASPPACLSAPATDPAGAAPAGWAAASATAAAVTPPDGTPAPAGRLGAPAAGSATPPGATTATATAPAAAGPAGATPPAPGVATVGASSASAPPAGPVEAPPTPTPTPSAAAAVASPAPAGPPSACPAPPGTAATATGAGALTAAGGSAAAASSGAGGSGLGTPARAGAATGPSSAGPPASAGSTGSNPAATGTAPDPAAGPPATAPPATGAGAPGAGGISAAGGVQQVAAAAPPGSP